MTDECTDCQIVRDKCLDCNREIANEHDEGIHNTGECSCDESRILCWRIWNEGRCEKLSPYDRDYKEPSNNIAFPYGI